MIDHVAVVEEAVSWIYEHPEERPSAEALSSRFSYSPDHFARLFKAVAGEPLGEFLKRIRLEQAACCLLKAPSLSVTEIAAAAGYSSSNFCVAFRRRYGLSPSRFRKDPRGAVTEGYQTVIAHIEGIRRDRAALERLEGCCTVRALPEMLLYRERYRGCYADLQPAWHSFCLRTTVKFPGLAPRYIGISRDDPLVSDPRRSSYDLCLAVPEGRGPSFLRIPAGVYAVLTYDGPITGLLYCFNELLAIWMPRHALTMGEGPTLEIYTSEARADGTIAVDLCVPARA